MIYDCFTFFNELDLLELRFEFLDKYVDWFVLSESPKTHSGKDKPLFYEQNKKRFSKFEHKIIHVVADEFPLFENSWSYENYQRNALVKGLKNCVDDDIIIISDLDEIPNLDLLPKKIKDAEVICFLQNMFYYYANNYKESQIIWEGGSKAVSFRTIKFNLLNEKFVKYNKVSFRRNDNEGTSFTKIRLYRNLRLVNNGGWHLSYMGGANLISAKLSATSHQEINTDEINREDFIVKCLEDGRDLLDPQKKCYILSEDKFPDLFIKVLPNSYYLKSGNQQNIVNYHLRRVKELVSVHIRNMARRLILNFFKI